MPEPAAAPVVGSAPAAGPFPLSPAQERFWFLESLEPGNPAHHVASAVRLAGELHVEALGRAVSEVVRRHEPLRTVFRRDGDRPAQWILPASPIELRPEDLSTLGPGARDAECRRLAELAAIEPFDLERGPVVRFTLLRLARDEHELLAAAHHAAADGLSAVLFLRELLDVYAALLAGAPASIPPPARPFREFAAEERRRASDPAFEPALAWWTEELRDVPPLALPADRERGTEWRRRGDRAALPPDRELGRRLSRAARSAGVTPFTAGLAAFAAWLWRMTGASDFAVGVPAANRERPGTESLIGFFVNSLPIRFRPDPDLGFDALLARTGAAVREAVRRQDVPFESVVERLNPERDPGRHPVFQTMFNWVPFVEERREIAGLAVEPRPLPAGTLVDFTLYLRAPADGIVIEAEYDRGLFDAATIHRWLVSFRTLLRAGLDDPKTAIAALPLLDDAGRARVLSAGDGGGVPADGDSSVEAAFERRTSQAPEAVAVDEPGRTVTCRELDEKILRVAAGLATRGLGPRSLVGVALRRAPALPAALLGIARAGAAWLPLDPNLPAGRLALLVEDAAPDLVIVDDDATVDLGVGTVRRVRYGELAGRDGGMAGAAPALTSGCAPSGEDLLYLIHTSGSSGRPKGVRIPRRAAAAALAGLARAIALGPGDTFLAITTIGFDIAVFELLGPLAAGAAVRIATDDEVADPARLAALLARPEITVAQATPSRWRMLLDAGFRPRPGLRLLCGGEALDPELARRLASGGPLWNAYGPTETTIWSTIGRVDAESVTLGRPIPGTRVRVTDDRGEPVPSGVAGELRIGGAGLALGYHRRPDAEAERFVVDAAGERWYRTGDRARQRPDGALLWVGRLDDQIKVRGHRIEPAEVEAAILATGLAAEAAVAGAKSPDGGVELRAWVVPAARAGDAGPRTEALDAWRAVWEATFRGDRSEGAPGRDRRGWVDSRTGLPLPEAALLARAGAVAALVLEDGAESVLEIGCGTGLLTFALAPRAREIVAVDASEAAVAAVREQARALGRSGVEALAARADDLAALGGRRFDAVVLNSVVQYFPDADYLRECLDAAFAHVRPGGRLVVGDVRNLALLGAFHLWVALARAGDAVRGDALRAQVDRRVRDEPELLVDPAWFRNWSAGQPDARIERLGPEAGGGDDELGRFRYDVVVRRGIAEEAAPAAGDARDAVRVDGGGLDLAAVEAAVRAESGRPVVVRGVANARAAGPAAALAALEGGADAGSNGLRARADAAARDAVEPDALLALGRNLGRAVSVAFSEGRADGALDVVFAPPGRPAFPPPPDRPAEAGAGPPPPVPSWTNRPSRAAAGAALAAALRDALRRRLPEAFVPARIVVLDRLPRLPGGKIDRRRLPEPGPARAPLGADPPRAGLEAEVAAAWCELLDLATTGRAEDWFALGGHSLLATRLLARIESRLGTAVPLRAFFAAPTVAGLADALRARRALPAGGAPAAPEGDGSSDGSAPADGGGPVLTPGQERLWFLHRLDPASPAYVMAAAVRLRGAIDIAALRAALQELVRRHEALRTVVVEEAGRPRPVLRAEAEFPLRVDARGEVSSGARDAALDAAATAEVSVPFDLARGPLARGALLRFAADDHGLVLAVHHVAADGRSLALLARELAGAYAARRGGGSLPEPTAADVWPALARRQRDAAESAAGRRLVEEWTAHLAGAPRRIDLPGDFPRPEFPAHRGRTLRLGIPPELDAATTAGARRLGATPFAVRLAAFEVLLLRLTGESDLVVGTTVDLRSGPEGATAVGFLVNTLPLRTRLDGDPSFADAVRRVHATLVFGLGRADVPFAKLVEGLGVPRDASRNPVFQVCFDDFDVPAAELAFPDVEAEVRPVETGAAKFDLGFRVERRGGATALAVEFDSALFAPETAQAWGEAWQAILGNGIADPAAPVSRIPMLDATGRERALAGGIGPSVALPHPTFVHAFEAAARARPDAPALVAGGRVVTYGALAAAARALAVRLRHAGAGRGDRVAVLLPRSVDLVVALAGTLRAGCAFVPLDPEGPPERRALILEDARPRTVVTSAALAPRWTGAAAPVLIDDGGEAGGGEPAPDDLPPLPGAEDPAYVLHTSGSTGRPKGVVVAHRGLANYVFWAGAAYDAGRGAGSPLHTPVTYDLSVTSLFVPLAAGGAVILAGEGAGLEGLDALVRPDAGWTLLKVTPGHVEGLSAAAAPGNLRGAARVWVAGGEALRHEDLRRLRAESPASRIVNEYGPTEATVGCCAHEIAPGDPASGPVPIGRPIWNTVLRVLDDHGALVSPGVPGELCVGGAGLALGYLGQPEPTLRAFVPDPFGPPGALLYRTGDLVRRRGDGALVFVGRRDEQVKIQGVRVEPGETRAALRALPDVRDAAVLARPGPGGRIRLLAWVEVPDGADVSSFRALLRDRLPGPFVPAAIVAVPRLPLTPHGKLDARALPEPPAGDAARAAPPEPPAGPVETALAEAWAEVLGSEAVPGRGDDFFALGGDSILSLLLVARFRARGFALRPRDVFLHPTLARMAAAAVPAADDAPVLPPAAPGADVPLLPAQEWLLGLGLPALRHWNQALAFEVAAAISGDALHAAIEAVVRHHETFRLRFRRKDGAWRATVAAEAPLLWRVIDLAGAPPSARPAAEASAAASAQGALDVGNGPLAGAVLFAGAAGSPSKLLWFAHHLAVDGVSWRILVEDLVEALRAGAAGVEPRLPPAPCPLSAWAARRAALPADGAGAPAGKPGPGGTGDAFPWPRAAGAFGTEGTAVAVEVACDSGVTARLFDRAVTGPRTAPPDLLLAALALALRDRAAPGPWIVDVEGHGRDRAGDGIDLSRTVGWLTEIRALRIDAPPEAGPVEVLRNVKSRRRTSSGPLRTGRAAAEVAPAQVLFNYLGQVPVTGAGGPLRLLPEAPGPRRGPENPRTHLLEIDALAAGGRLRVRWAGDGTLLDRARLVALAAGFDSRLAALIDALAADPAEALVPSDFPLAALDEAGLAAILRSDPDPADILPLTPTQQGMFFHGLREPESPAYLEQAAQVFEGALDAPALRDAYAATLERHDLFRARIAWRGLPEPHFVIGRALDLPWTFLDWSGTPEAGERARLAEHLVADRRPGVDLERGPLFRIALARLRPDRHALVFTWHHVLLDGWSLPLLLGEVLQAYAALRSGRTPALPPAPPFRDHVARLRSQDEEAQRRFWRTRLAGFSEPTAVALRPPPAPGAPAAVDLGETEAALDPGAVRDLETRCRELGVTPAVLAQGAWALALARWTSATDVVFGLTVSGRQEGIPGEAERIGLFINTVPVRVRIPADADAAGWLRALQREQAERAEHELTPLPLAQAQSDVPKETPLFESLLVFENYPVEAALRDAPGGFRVCFGAGFERTSYPVTAVAVPGRPFVLRVLSDRARIGDDAARRLLGLFARAAAELAAPGDLSLGDLLRPDPGEAGRLRDLGLGPAFPSPPADPLALLLDHARRRPEACAVTDGVASFTGAALDRFSADLAARLRPHLRGDAPVVALLAGRSVEAVAGICGILRAGAAWMPVDPALPAERRRALLAGGGAVAIVAAEEDTVPEVGLPVIALRASGATAPPPPAGAAAPGRLAYVIHTSGSTGRPKPVAVGREALAGFVAWAVGAYGLAPGDRVLHFASLGFDTSVEEILPPLAAGAAVVVRGAEDAASADAFAAALRRLRPTVVDLPTGFWNELVPALRPEQLDAWADVRLLVLGGEAAGPRALRRWRRLFGPRIRVFNTYGPTETTVVATCADLTGALGDPVEDPLPIGRPRAGAEVLVAGGEGRLLPEGVPGELLIGGACLADVRGDSTEFQARTAFAHPFRAGERVHRTGDRVRFRSDGQLEFLGRLDGQVKVRGQRVEPAEVEAALLRHPGVAAAAVVAEGEGAARRLLAFVQAASGTEVLVESVLDTARRILPPAWAPARCVLVPAIPRLPSGKIDRRRLAAAAGHSAAKRPGRDAPAAAPERVARLCRLFEDVLETRPVGPRDGFLALGGHSLTALRLLARIESEFGRSPPIRILLEDPTPAGLAAALDLPEAGVETAALAAAADEPDLRGEAVLPADIRPAAGGAPASPPRRVLLTGATGFLGAHVLAELLARGLDVVALARASGEVDARRRVDDAARRFGLPAPSAAAGFRAVAGRIEAPGLGLAPADLALLGRSVDAIVHAAAGMSFLASYRELHPVNVRGTIEVLRFAVSGRPKAVHHVSTAGLLAAAAPGAVEESPLDRPEVLAGGYLRSKWVAEALVREAGRRGVPFTIHRPGLVVGDSRTGIGNDGDFAHRVLSACLALGLLPDLELSLDAIPADVAARSLVALALDPDRSGRTFHLFDDAAPSSGALRGLLREAGARFETVPPAEWRREFLDEFRLRPDDPRAVLLPFVAATPDRLLPPGPRRRASAARTRAALAGLGIPFPAPDAAWFSKVLARLQGPLRAPRP